MQMLKNHYKIILNLIQILNNNNNCDFVSLKRKSESSFYCRLIMVVEVIIEVWESYTDCILVGIDQLLSADDWAEYSKPVWRINTNRTGVEQCRFTWKMVYITTVNGRFPEYSAILKTSRPHLLISSSSWNVKTKWISRVELFSGFAMTLHQKTQ